MGVVFIAWIPSLIVSIDPLKSLEVWGRTAAYLCLGTLPWAFLRNNQSVLRVAQIVLIAAAAVSVLLIAVNFLGGTEYIRALRFKAFTEGYPPKVMKHYAAPAVCLIPLLLCIGYLQKGAVRAWCVAICAGFVSFLYLTGAGAAAIGLLFGIYCFSIVWMGRRRLAIPMIGAVLLVLVIAGWYLWFAGQSISDHSNFDEYPVSPLAIDRHRQIIWMFVLSNIPDALWTGYGIDAINKIDGAGAIIKVLDAEYLPSHPHSWALEILTETGVFGLLAFLTALGVGFYGACRHAISGSAASLAMVALLGIYFGSGLFSFSFWASWWQLVLIIIWAQLAAMPERTE